MMDKGRRGLRACEGVRGGEVKRGKGGGGV